MSRKVRTAATESSRAYYDSPIGLIEIGGTPDGLRRRPPAKAVASQTRGGIVVVDWLETLLCCSRRFSSSQLER